MSVIMILIGDRRPDPVGFEGWLADTKRVSEIPGKKAGGTLIEKYRDFLCKTPPLKVHQTNNIQKKSL